jgi:hypothetical protein
MSRDVAMFILVADQFILAVIATVAVIFAYQASRNSRWLQEVVVPLLSHMLTLIDPDYPKPPDPPPING